MSVLCGAGYVKTEYVCFVWRGVRKGVLRGCVQVF